MMKSSQTVSPMPISKCQDFRRDCTNETDSVDSLKIYRYSCLGLSVESVRSAQACAVSKLEATRKMTDVIQVSGESQSQPVTLSVSN